MQWPELITMNCLRRDDSTYWKSIYAGDVLNLDPHTALSVGTQVAMSSSNGPTMTARCGPMRDSMMCV
jgi:hypothetical protein